MGTITNDTFNPIRAYSNVRLQQGVPLVDADVNELDDIRKFDLRAFLKWFVGNGNRLGGDGFHILQASPASATNVMISSGAGNTITTTTAVYTQLTNAGASNPSVSVAVVSSAAFTVNQFVAVLQADGLFAGIYKVTSKPDATHVAIQRPQYAPGVANTTVVTTAAKIIGAASDVTTTGLNLLGRILVDGLEVLIPSDKLYSEQLISGADVGVVPALPATIPSGTNVLLFLDVWERNVPITEDASLIVQPLNTESSVRTKRLWVVRARSGAVPQVLPVQGDGDWAQGHLYYPLASVVRATPTSTITTATITDLRDHGTLVSTIEQPSLPYNGKYLLLDCAATGFGGTHFRIYADFFGSIWFILNASWNGSAWVPDDNFWWTGGFRISQFDFGLFNNDPGAGSIASFQRQWNLPMTSGVNSAFETVGDIEEVGRLGMEMRNVASTSQTVGRGGDCTFRNRFPGSPSSVTLSPTDNFNFTGNPSVYNFDRDGFSFYSYQSLGAGTTAWWHGTYDAIA